MKFKLVSKFKPTGDQPEAIKKILLGLDQNFQHQCLLGVTGSGKTFTMANVINNSNRPALILCHNKTLAAQLYSEFKLFFPDNAVEYFVSYYDYYQPEAYIPQSGLYIEKDLSINEEIEKLRLSTTTSLLSGRNDVIVVSSVSCIYGIGNPEEFHKKKIILKVGQNIKIEFLLLKLVESLYSRTETEIKRGQYRIKGDCLDIFPAYSDICLRIYFWDEEIESIETFNPENGFKIDELNTVNIFPANQFVTSKEKHDAAIKSIRKDLINQIEYFKVDKKNTEANRIKERVNFDLEMIQELGYCSGIENYSRYFDGRAPGKRPFCLIDYFPNNFLTFIDESHVTLPQIRAMYGGDRSRKENLVEYGFRLPSAMDNRPLKFNEFESIVSNLIYVSATPGEYEYLKSDGIVIEQIIRPTGILDPVIEIKPSKNQIDDLFEEISSRVEKNERILITTLTKRMSEDLSKYLTKNGVLCKYIHSDIDTIERVEIMRDLRLGKFDVLVGVNLLREGLDLPEVSLVSILDADKEGFLRSKSSLIQTVGRCARNINGKAIFYADKITKSMRDTINDNEYKRKIQKKYNQINKITPYYDSSNKSNLTENSIIKKIETNKETEKNISSLEFKKLSKIEKIKTLKLIKTKMVKASKNFNFVEAANLRDQIKQFEKIK